MLRATLEQWRMFKAVVEHGGFNQAAQQIHKSQSSIHTAVNKLENALGVQLLKVEGRKTMLTDAGTMMLRRAEFLLAEASKIEAVGQALGGGVESSLKIAVDEIFPSDILYRALDNTSKEYPHLRIELIETVLSGASELLTDAKVDIAITGVVPKGMFSEELCGMEFVAVAHPLHPLHQIERPLTEEDLKSFRQIVVRDSAHQSSIDSGWLGADQRWTVSHLRTSLDMIQKKMGFAWLPRSVIREALACGELKALNLARGQTRHAMLHLAFDDGDQLGPAARTLLGELRHLTL